MHSFETLIYEVDGPLVTVTINRPKVLNALSAQVLDELHAAIGHIGQDKSLRAVILTGAGEKAFVAGADISAMAHMTPEQALKMAERGHAVLHALESLPQPVIGAINGFALGGGTELALACDVLYASTNARFGQPEVNIGVMPGFGGTQRLPRRINPGLAAELIFAGDPIDAETALRLGLVNAVVPQAELLEKARTLGRKIATRAPRAVALAKQALRAAREQPFLKGCREEQELFAELFKTRDQKEGMAAFLGKRPPSYTGE